MALKGLAQLRAKAEVEPGIFAPTLVGTKVKVLHLWGPPTVPVSVRCIRDGERVSASITGEFNAFRRQMAGLASLCVSTIVGFSSDATILAAGYWHTRSAMRVDYTMARQTEPGDGQWFMVIRMMGLNRLPLPASFAGFGSEQLPFSDGPRDRSPREMLLTLKQLMGALPSDTQGSTECGRAHAKLFGRQDSSEAHRRSIAHE